MGSETNISSRQPMITLLLDNDSIHFSPQFPKLAEFFLHYLTTYTFVWPWDCFDQVSTQCIKSICGCGHLMIYSWFALIQIFGMGRDRRKGINSTLRFPHEPKQIISLIFRCRLNGHFVGCGLVGSCETSKKSAIFQSWATPPGGKI